MLESIKSPQDIQHLSLAELDSLAQEIRAKIIKTVTKTGGHLGANLGVVELTIALHLVLDSPRDKIVWDVGHQSYPHKLLTNRYQEFASLRQLGGISGFPLPQESPHDIFGVGHSSTSISAALGIANARDLKGEDYKVVAVIGDGALTGGIAFEALNHTGQLDTDLVVILNDNAMSIAKNVGALNDYLSKLRLDPTLSKVRLDLENLLRRIPAIGGSVSRLTLSLKDAIKGLLPGQLFEELGFSYFGPFDGHNIRQVQRAIGDGINRGGPVLIHVVTQKGRGYTPAEKNPTLYHGLGPSYSRNQSASMSFSDVFGETMEEIAEKDKRLVAVTAAMEDGTGLKKFAKRFPNRIFDVGIAEQHALTFAAGMANQGLRPVVAIYSTFLQRGYDQLLHDICLQKLPVIIAIDRSGVVGEDGPTHHGVFDISYLNHIPNLTLLAPKDGAELKAMLNWAFNQSGPVAIRYPRGQTASEPSVSFSVENPIPSEVLVEGSEVVILAVGNMVHSALKAAQLLEPDHKTRVVNMRTLKPLSQESLNSLTDNAALICVVEDNVVTGGFGSYVATVYGNSDRRVISLGYPDSFIPQGRIEQLHEMYALTPADIANSIKEAMLKVGYNVKR